MCRSGCKVQYSPAPSSHFETTSALDSNGPEKALPIHSVHQAQAGPGVGAQVDQERLRVRNNLAGTPDFCPMVFRTDALDKFVTMDLVRQAQAAIAAVPRDLLARTAAFLLLKDSKSSYAIEGEHAPQDRIQRWGRAIAEAGRNPMDFDELLRLQEIVIGDARFVAIRLPAPPCGGISGSKGKIPTPV